MPNAVKNTTFPNLFDLLSPHHCIGCGTIGKSLCEECKTFLITHHINTCPLCDSLTNQGKCPNCRHLQPTFIAGERSSLLGQLIHDFKYNSNRSLAKPLAQILDSILPRINSKVILVPLPTSPQHIRSRGLDHTLLLAKNLAQIRGKNYQVQSLFIRTNNSTQVGSDRQTRLRQAIAAYKLPPDFIPQSNAIYVLIDDVWTTGASMQSATHLLESCGTKKIIQALLAVSKSL